MHLVVYCLLHSIPNITEMQVGVEVYMLHVYRINHDKQLCNSYVMPLEEQLETLDKDSITGCTSLLL